MTIDYSDIFEAARYIEHAKNSARGGPPRITHCKRGHDLEEHGRQKWKINDYGVRVKCGRYCNKCKRDAQRTPGAEERINAQKPREPGRNPFADDYVPAERSHHKKEKR